MGGRRFRRAAAVTALTASLGATGALSPATAYAETVTPSPSSGLSTSIWLMQPSSPPASGLPSTEPSKEPLPASPHPSQERPTGLAASAVPAPSASVSPPSGPATPSAKPTSAPSEPPLPAAPTGAQLLPGLPAEAISAELVALAEAADRAQAEVVKAADAYAAAQARHTTTTIDKAAAGRELATTRARLHAEKVELGQIAAQLYRGDQASSPLAPWVIMVGSDDPQGSVSALAYLGSVGDNRIAAIRATQRDEARVVELTRRAAELEAAAQAEVGALQTALAEATASADAAETAQQSLTESLTPQLQAQLSASESRWNQAGTALWNTYVARLTAARLMVPARTLNDPAAWRKDWRPVLGADGQPQAGVAQTSDVQGPLVIVPLETVLAVRTAFSRLGAPYLWGGIGPVGWDCSGLTLTSFAAAGVALPRVAVDQWAVTAPVALADALPGDLVYFANSSDGLHHVGIYLGAGLMLNAPRTGAPVRVQPLLSDLYAAGRATAPRRAPTTLPALAPAPLGNWAKTATG